MKKYKITIIVPCHNSAQFLESCFNHLEQQTIGIDNLQIILVNDASTDNTLEILTTFKDKYPNNTIILNFLKNIMQGAARNSALKHALGEYTLFCDSDDSLPLYTCEYLYDLAIKNNLDMIEGERCTFANGKPLASNPTDSQITCTLFDLTNIESRKYFLINNIFNDGHVSKLYRTEFLNKYNFQFKEGITIYEEPLFVYPQLLYVDRVAKTSKIVYNVNLTPNSATRHHSAPQYSNSIMRYPEAQKDLLYWLKNDVTIFSTYKDEILLYFFKYNIRSVLQSKYPLYFTLCPDPGNRYA